MVKRRSGLKSVVRPGGALGLKERAASLSGERTASGLNPDAVRPVAAVKRRRRIGESDIIGDVVVLHAIDIGPREVRTERTTGAEGDDRNIDDIIAETPAVGPAARNETAISKRVLKLAFENVPAEN